MGKSAKVHKRTKKTASSVSVALTTPPSKQTAPVAVASAAKKKPGTRKGRAKRPRPSGAGPVLGGADYVDIMFGSRRREREEAQKLPRND
ncbi:hypothetical protein BJY52DRAFT_582234 [Lactarius psammicola]|nr:hypothetical protein BJY52DRAFT_582234 [Lactarius psammicola]